MTLAITYLIDIVTTSMLNLRWVIIARKDSGSTFRTIKAGTNGTSYLTNTASVLDAGLSPKDTLAKKLRCGAEFVRARREEEGIVGV
jgi:hypothetical protein